MTRPTRSHHRTLTAVVTVVLLMASCSGDDDEAGAEETTTTTVVETTAPPTTLSVEEEVEAAFHEFDAVMAELGPEPNPDDPRLPEMVLEPQLIEIRDSLAESVATNQVYEIGDESSYAILTTTVDATGATATLIVCTVAADRLVDRDTGHVVSDGASTLKEEITYRRQNDRWMLEEYQNLDFWDGITTCE